MIMGFISFAILLGAESSSTTFSATNQWYQSFHLAHIVILFIGITFMCQAVLLVSLISFRNRTLLSYGNSNPEKLALEYITIHNDGGLKRWFFDHGLISIPFPQVRERIEYKMLQEFFINFYSLPREFKFANYMSQALKDYIISLVEVRPITWIVLVALIAINYLRIIWVDPQYQHDVCERYPAKTLEYGVHRLLGGGSGSSTDAQFEAHHAYEVCNEYTLRYVFFCSMLIVFYLLGVFIASEVYMQRLISKVLDVEESIEKEEDRLASEDVPLYDIDDLHDRESSVAASDPPDATLSPTSRSPPLRRAVGSGPIRRTASNQSLDSLPSQPHLDVEQGNAAHPQRGGRSSTASIHRGSFTLPFFGGGEDAGGVAQALHGIVLGKNRRHLYLHCIQRMIQSEEEVTKKEARRLSIGSDDGGMHSPPNLTTSSGAVHRTSLQSASGSRPRHLQLDSSNISEIYDQHFHHRYHGHANQQGYHHGHGAEDSAYHSASSAPTLGIHGGEGGALHRLWDRTFHPHHQQHAGPSSPQPDHGHHPAGHAHSGHGAGHGRARAYSAQFFEIEKSTTNEDADEEEKNATGVCTPCLTFVLLTAYKLLCQFLMWARQTLINTLMGHHIGQTHQEVQPDKDIKHRLQAFRSIFMWSRPGLYYFAVELSLLIQCFYIALWSTNFVVIARDSYFPVLWEIALVVPLPINFFLLKQIIYTSCMIKSIVHINQRTANRIIEQAVDERNVTQRLRRIVRDTMKRWDVSRKEWRARLQSHFESFADVDNTIDKENFKAFLHDVKIFFTDESLKNLFKVIDVDRDGRISWSIVSTIVFPEHKKQKKIKLKKRQTERGRVAFEYVVSEEAKKEMEKENERRSSVLAMLSRVSASTAEGAINVVRSNSLTRMSMIAMLGSQSTSNHGNAAGVSNPPESKLSKLFPKIPSASPSPSSTSRKRLGANADDDASTAAAAAVTAAAPAEPPTPVTSTAGVSREDGSEEEEGADEEDEEDQFESNDSTGDDSGDEHDDEDEMDDEEDFDIYKQLAPAYEDANEGSGYTYGVQTPSEEAGPVRPAVSTVVASSTSGSVTTSTAVPTPDVITLNWRISNARISARNLFDI
jgi:hypothetical protein